MLPLVEIVPGRETSDEAIKTMHDLFAKMGKRPVILHKEIPGFIANRFQAAIFREAISIVQKGIASPKDIDTVIKNGFGRRYAVAGIFELADIAGLDVGLSVIFQLFPILNLQLNYPNS